MSQALYRKYRSRSFEEIVGQESVVAALSHAVSSGDIGHAYLFTGPRGVGKTSIARILAYAINNVPYDSEELPIDIIEIDAASNRGIDEVRDLREKVRIAPVVGPYKIYIIDEVHMLTSHAFNALLKTLEEPPAHVVFILATTEGHKLPDTITSRTQRYVFKLAPQALVTSYLKDISAKENINIDEDALGIIASHSGGSLRDALSMLDHARHLSSHITAEQVLDTAGLPDEALIDDLMKSINNCDVSNIISCIETIESRSISPNLVAQAISSKITYNLQNGTNLISVAHTAQLLSDLAELESSINPLQRLNIALIKACSNSPAEINNSNQDTHINTSDNKNTSSKNLKISESLKTKNIQNTDNKLEDKNTHNKVVSKQIDKPKEDIHKSASSDTISNDIWGKVLEELRLTHNTLYSVLRMAHFDEEKSTDSAVLLNFDFPFHLKRVNEAKNKSVLQQKFASIGHESIEIICELKSKIDTPSENEKNKNNIEPTNNNDAMMSKIRGVFGAAEVLE